MGTGNRSPDQEIKIDERFADTVRPTESCFVVANFSLRRQSGFGEEVCVRGDKLP